MKLSFVVLAGLLTLSSIADAASIAEGTAKSRRRRRAKGAKGKSGGGDLAALARLEESVKKIEARCDMLKAKVDKAMRRPPPPPPPRRPPPPPPPPPPAAGVLLKIKKGSGVAGKCLTVKSSGQILMFEPCSGSNPMQIWSKNGEIKNAKSGLCAVEGGTIC